MTRYHTDRTPPCTVDQWDCCVQGGTQMRIMSWEGRYAIDVVVEPHIIHTEHRTLFEASSLNGQHKQGLGLTISRARYLLPCSWSIHCCCVRGWRAIPLSDVSYQRSHQESGQAARFGIIAAGSRFVAATTRTCQNAAGHGAS